MYQRSNAYIFSAETSPMRWQSSQKCIVDRWRWASLTTPIPLIPITLNWSISYKPNGVLYMLRYYITCSRSSCVFFRAGENQKVGQPRV